MIGAWTARYVHATARVSELGNMHSIVLTVQTCGLQSFVSRLPVVVCIVIFSYFSKKGL